MLADASSAPVLSLVQCAKHLGCERACSVHCELTSITFSRVACRRDFGELQRRYRHALVCPGAYRVIELVICAAHSASSCALACFFCQQCTCSFTSSGCALRLPRPSASSSRTMRCVGDANAHEIGALFAPKMSCRFHAFFRSPTLADASASCTQAHACRCVTSAGWQGCSLVPSGQPGASVASVGARR